MKFGCAMEGRGGCAAAWMRGWSGGEAVQPLGCVVAFGVAVLVLPATAAQRASQLASPLHTSCQPRTCWR